MSIVSFVNTLRDNAVDFVFPSRCLVCDERRDQGERWLCRSCLETLEANAAAREACPRCAGNLRKGPCDCSSGWDHPFEKIHAVYDFDDIIRKMIHGIKYAGFSRLAAAAGTRAAGQVPGEFFRNADAMVSVPLHFFKRFKRGYNQSDSLAVGFLHGTGLQIPLLKKCVVRNRNTKTQTALDKNQRKDNMAGAFRISGTRKKWVQGKTIILVDDVVTTGATTAACGRALLDAGASAVRVLCLARD